MNKPFIPCRKCKGNPRQRIPEGFYEDTNYPGFIIECEHHIKWKKDCDSFLKFKRNGFREDLWDWDIHKDYVGEQSRITIDRIIKFVDVFALDNLVKGSTLYLVGRNGCQKTLVSNWIGSQLIRKDINCMYILMNELVNLLIGGSYKSDKDLNIYDELINKLKNCDVLICDESFDRSKVTIYNSAYQISFLDSFIRDRTRRKCNIFISNVEINDINDIFGPSLKSLLDRETNFFNSCLRFEDNWIDNAGKPPKDLF